MVSSIFSSSSALSKEASLDQRAEAVCSQEGENYTFSKDDIPYWNGKVWLDGERVDRIECNKLDRYSFGEKKGTLEMALKWGQRLALVVILLTPLWITIYAWRKYSVVREYLVTNLFSLTIPYVFFFLDFNPFMLLAPILLNLIYVFTRGFDEKSRVKKTQLFLIVSYYLVFTAFYWWRSMSPYS